MTNIAALFFLSASCVQAAPSVLLALQDSFASVADKAKPAVVNITAIHEEQVYLRSPYFFFGDPDDFSYGIPRRHPSQPYRWKTQGTGSGVLVDSRGYVLTNEHVVRGADEIQITLTSPDGKEKTYPGKVAGRDSILDLAVVKIQTPGTYPSLKLGDSSAIRVGNWILAIGSPFQLQQTVTAGIVSAVRQSILIEGRRYVNLIQTDAAINMGNSGGPLLNLESELIGINTAIYSPSGAFAGIGFAIPINEARDFIESVLEGKKLRYGWLGVELAPLDEVIQKRFGLPASQGAIVNYVVAGSPAQKAGIQRGDALLRFNGKEISSPQELIRLISRSKPEESVELEIVRQGKTIKVRLALGERPESTEVRSFRPQQEQEIRKMQTLQWEGLELIQTKNGVMVHQVDRGSPLYGYLLEGDILRGINQNAVSSLENFQKPASQASLQEGVVFDILRRGQEMYISVQISR